MLFSSFSPAHLKTKILLTTLHYSFLYAQTYDTSSAIQAYLLNQTFMGSDFFTNWNFYSDTDPTNGYVDYQTADQAWSAGLVSTTNGSAYIGVDYNTIVDDAARGRKSVRIESQESWTQGLFVADIEHMSASVCGIWPAFWMLGSGTWPHNGEIDIIEGVNSMSDNLVSLHTSPDCTMMPGAMSGQVNCLDCDGTLNSNSACNANAKDSIAIGSGFNGVSGGVYAMEWTSSAIQVWFFPRSSIPADISSGNPDPSTWGAPQTHYQGGTGCEIDDHFAEHRLIFNTDFCGDWAGSSWSSDSECSAKAATCAGYVKGNPRDFADAYWLINSVNVYQLGVADAVASGSAVESSLPSATRIESEESSTTIPTISTSSFHPRHTHSWLSNSTLYNSTHHHHNGTWRFNSTITSTVLSTLILSKPTYTSTLPLSTTTMQVPEMWDYAGSAEEEDDGEIIITQLTTITAQEDAMVSTATMQKREKRGNVHLRRHLRGH